MSGYVLTAQPNSEPVSLAQAKLHLKVDNTNDDTLITTLIQAAREWADRRDMPKKRPWK